MQKRKAAKKSTQANAQTLVASAEKIDFTDHKARNKYKNSRQPWQEEAWKYYDTIGEVWFAHQFKANALRRVRLCAAEILDDSEVPSLITNEIASGDSLAAQAVAEVSRVQTRAGGQGEILADMSVNLGVPGDLTLVGFAHDPETDEEEWRVCSSSELVEIDGVMQVIDEPDSRDGIPITENDITIRVWRPHPRYRGLADSEMKAVLDSCDELDILSKGIRATGRSRVAGAGVLLIPSEITFDSADETEDPGDGNARTDPFLRDLMQAMIEPIADESHPSSIVPLVVRAPGETIAQVKHIVFERPIDPVAAQQRSELLRRIANGIDLPPEIMLGMSDANHWTAWQVDEQTFKAHIEPTVIMICNALTEGVLRPALEREMQETGRRFVVWYDAAQLVSHPNRAEDAKAAHTAITISDEAYRRYMGFPDSDAPDEDEIRRRIALSGVITPELTIELLKLMGVVPEGLVVASPEPPVLEIPELPPEVDKKAKAETVEPGPPKDEKAVTAGGVTTGFASAKKAAAAPRKTDLGDKLLRVDREARMLVSSAADSAIQRAIELAGASVRRKLQRDPALSAKIKTLKNEDIFKAVGPERIRQFANEYDLIDGEFGPLKERYMAYVTRAQKQALALIEQYDNEDREDRAWDNDELEARQAEDANAGWAILASGLAVYAGYRLYQNATRPAQGEYDDAITVPQALIRESLARAGGAPIQGTTTISAGSISKVMQDATGLLLGPADEPVGGIATGQLVRDALASTGLRIGGYVWVYGDAGSRKFANFDPHMDLDGQTFSSWTDEVLMTDVTAWPFVSYYYPGDHLYCQCDFVPEILMTTKEDQ